MTRTYVSFIHPDDAEEWMRGFEPDDVDWYILVPPNYPFLNDIRWIAERLSPCDFGEFDLPDGRVLFACCHA